jgi:hypothetical protein
MYLSYSLIGSMFSLPQELSWPPRLSAIRAAGHIFVSTGQKAGCQEGRLPRNIHSFVPYLQEKLQRRVASVEVKILNPPRPGKKCLVIDIDYTIFDLGTPLLHPLVPAIALLYQRPLQPLHDQTKTSFQVTGSA